MVYNKIAPIYMRKKIKKILNINVYSYSFYRIV